ncbi:hypothetical protein N656DRAFT_377285 [Canariomyces notabilis]|uniref:Uncharacterized protein n=1 Tax=Canariomyces notabilis TaxID=2074819 RepID=A0AAN6T9C4_9PEZI|nr:hypothetical protein N656DRAFT_377285 [Canariomyces arenarius]
MDPAGRESRDPLRSIRHLIGETLYRLTLAQNLQTNIRYALWMITFSWCLHTRSRHTASLKRLYLASYRSCWLLQVCSAGTCKHKSITAGSSIRPCGRRLHTSYWYPGVTVKNSSPYVQYHEIYGATARVSLRYSKSTGSGRIHCPGAKHDCKWEVGVKCEPTYADRRPNRRYPFSLSSSLPARLHPSTEAVMPK